MGMDGQISALSSQTLFILVGPNVDETYYLFCKRYWRRFTFVMDPGNNTTVKDVWYSMAQKMLKFMFYAVVQQKLVQLLQKPV